MMRQSTWCPGSERSQCSPTTAQLAGSPTLRYADRLMTSFVDVPPQPSPPVLPQTQEPLALTKRISNSTRTVRGTLVWDSQPAATVLPSRRVATSMQRVETFMVCIQRVNFSQVIRGFRTRADIHATVQVTATGSTDMHGMCPLAGAREPTASPAIRMDWARRARSRARWWRAGDGLPAIAAMNAMSTPSVSATRRHRTRRP